MRSSGVRGVLVYCSDFRCSHSVAIDSNRWPDHVRLSDLEPQFVCKACGKRGADVIGAAIMVGRIGSRGIATSWTQDKWSIRRWLTSATFAERMSFRLRLLSPARRFSPVFGHLLQQRN